MKATEPGDFIANLNAGVFASQVGAALSQVSAGVVEYRKKGKVTLTFDIAAIGDDSHQVEIAHKLTYTEPTKRGERSEHGTTKTPMHVTANGLQLFADNPTGQLFKREQAPVEPRT